MTHQPPPTLLSGPPTHPPPQLTTTQIQLQPGQALPPGYTFQQPPPHTATQTAPPPGHPPPMAGHSMLPPPLQPGQTLIQHGQPVPLGALPPELTSQPPPGHPSLVQVSAQHHEQLLNSHPPLNMPPPPTLHEMPPPNFEHIIQVTAGEQPQGEVTLLHRLDRPPPTLVDGEVMTSAPQSVAMQPPPQFQTNIPPPQVSVAASMQGSYAPHYATPPPPIQANASSANAVTSHFLYTAQPPPMLASAPSQFPAHVQPTFTVTHAPSVPTSAAPPGFYQQQPQHSQPPLTSTHAPVYGSQAPPTLTSFSHATSMSAMQPTFTSATSQAMTSVANHEQARPTSDTYYSQYLQQGGGDSVAVETTSEGQFAGAHGVGAGSKRKFREEKDDDKVSESVVGYQVTNFHKIF